jgi:protein-tyrosine phosphatase
MVDSLDAGRRLHVEGAYNIRDIGGYPTQDGRQTRWRTFIRADDLSRLPPASQATLVDYGIRTVIDLRLNDEVEKSPDVFSRSPDVVYHHKNMIGDPPYSDEGEYRESGEPSERIRLSYSQWLDRRQPRIGEILGILADPTQRPALYHCTGGKDRTGVISALLLGIAGVSADTIAEDYALSGRYLWDRHLVAPDPLEALANIEDWGHYQREFCPPDGMLKVLKHLDDSYGGVEAYCRTTGLTDDQIASLRNVLVE